MASTYNVLDPTTSRIAAGRGRQRVTLQLLALKATSPRGTGVFRLAVRREDSGRRPVCFTRHFWASGARETCVPHAIRQKRGLFFS